MHTETVSQAPYRSEAFAEDLDESLASPRPAGPMPRTTRVLLCLLPAILALASSAAAVRLSPT